MQATYLPLLPPTEEPFELGGGELIIDPTAFPQSFLLGLPGEWIGSVAVYDILVYEDPATRERVFLNGAGEMLCAIDPPPGYDPFFLLDRYSGATGDARDPSLYDASRLSFTFRLVLLGDWPLYQEEAALRSAAAVSPEKGGSAAQSESGSFRITALTRTGNDIAGNFPGDASCYYKLQSCADLSNGDWQTVNMELGVANEMSFTSSPEPVWGSFRVRQIPLTESGDEDGDGLDDVAELSLHGTDPLDTDTDGDGLSDGWEVAHGHNATTLDLVTDLNESDVAMESKGLGPPSDSSPRGSLASRTSPT